MSPATERDLAYDCEFSLRDLLDSDATAVEIYGSKLSLPEERKFGDVASVQRYVDLVLGLRQVRRRFPRAKNRVTVKAVKFRSQAHYEPAGQIIQVPTHDINKSTSWAMRELVVLHEIAHHLTSGDGHGAHWRGAFCFLVDDCIAPEAGFILKTGFIAAGLSITEPKES